MKPKVEKNSIQWKVLLKQFGIKEQLALIGSEILKLHFLDQVKVTEKCLAFSVESLKQKNIINEDLDKIKASFKTKLIWKKPGFAQEDFQNLAINQIALKNFHTLEHYIYTEGTLKQRLDELKFGEDSKKTLLEEIQTIKKNQLLETPMNNENKDQTDCIFVFFQGNELHDDFNRFLKDYFDGSAVLQQTCQSISQEQPHTSIVSDSFYSEQITAQGFSSRVGKDEQMIKEEDEEQQQKEQLEKMQINAEVVNTKPKIKRSHSSSSSSDSSSSDEDHPEKGNEIQNKDHKSLFQQNIQEEEKNQHKFQSQCQNEQTQSVSEEITLGNNTLEGGGVRRDANKIKESLKKSQKLTKQSQDSEGRNKQMDKSGNDLELDELDLIAKQKSSEIPILGASDLEQTVSKYSNKRGKKRGRSNDEDDEDNEQTEEQKQEAYNKWMKDNNTQKSQQPELITSKNTPGETPFPKEEEKIKEQDVEEEIETEKPRQSKYQRRRRDDDDKNTDEGNQDLNQENNDQSATGTRGNRDGSATRGNRGVSSTRENRDGSASRGNRQISNTRGNQRERGDKRNQEPQEGHYQQDKYVQGGNNNIRQEKRQFSKERQQLPNERGNTRDRQNKRDNKYQSNNEERLQTRGNNNYGSDRNNSRGNRNYSSSRNNNNNNSGQQEQTRGTQGYQGNRGNNNQYESDKNDRRDYQQQRNSQQRSTSQKPQNDNHRGSSYKREGSNKYQQQQYQQNYQDNSQHPQDVTTDNFPYNKQRQNYYGDKSNKQDDKQYSQREADNNNGPKHEHYINKDKRPYIKKPGNTRNQMKYNQNDATDEDKKQFLTDYTSNNTVSKIYSKTAGFEDYNEGKSGVQRIEYAQQQEIVVEEEEAPVKRKYQKRTQEPQDQEQGRDNEEPQQQQQQQRGNRVFSKDPNSRGQVINNNSKQYQSDHRGNYNNNQRESSGYQQNNNYHKNYNSDRNTRNTSKERNTYNNYNNSNTNNQQERRTSKERRSDNETGLNTNNYPNQRGNDQYQYQSKNTKGYGKETQGRNRNNADEHERGLLDNSTNLDTTFKCVNEKRLNMISSDNQSSNKYSNQRQYESEGYQGNSNYNHKKRIEDDQQFEQPKTNMRGNKQYNDNRSDSDYYNKNQDQYNQYNKNNNYYNNRKEYDQRDMKNNQQNEGGNFNGNRNNNYKGNSYNNQHAPSQDQKNNNYNNNNNNNQVFEKESNNNNSMNQSQIKDGDISQNRHQYRKIDTACGEGFAIEADFKKTFIFALIYKQPINVQVLKEFNAKKNQDSDDSDLSFEGIEQMQLKIRIFQKSKEEAERLFYQFVQGNVLIPISDNFLPQFEQLFPQSLRKVIFHVFNSIQIKDQLFFPDEIIERIEQISQDRSFLKKVVDMMAADQARFYISVREKKQQNKAELMKGMQSEILRLSQQFLENQVGNELCYSALRISSTALNEYIEKWNKDSSIYFITQNVSNSSGKPIVVFRLHTLYKYDKNSDGNNVYQKFKVYIERLFNAYGFLELPLEKKEIALSLSKSYSSQISQDLKFEVFLCEARLIPRNMNSLEDSEKTKFFKKISDKKIRTNLNKTELDIQDSTDYKVIVSFKCPVDQVAQVLEEIKLLFNNIEKREQSIKTNGKFGIPDDEKEQQKLSKTLVRILTQEVKRHCNYLKYDGVSYLLSVSSSFDKVDVQFFCKRTASSITQFQAVLENVERNINKIEIIPCKFTIDDIEDKFQSLDSAVSRNLMEGREDADDDYREKIKEKEQDSPDEENMNYDTKANNKSNNNTNKSKSSFMKNQNFYAFLSKYNVGIYKGSNVDTNKFGCSLIGLPSDSQSAFFFLKSIMSPQFFYKKSWEKEIADPFQFYIASQKVLPSFLKQNLNLPEQYRNHAILVGKDTKTIIYYADHVSDFKKEFTESFEHQLTKVIKYDMLISNNAQLHKLRSDECFDELFKKFKTTYLLPPHYIKGCKATFQFLDSESKIRCMQFVSKYYF